MMTPIPPHFGEYQTIKPLGEGGMGQVYLAFDSKLQRYVAIKTLHQHVLAELSTEYAQRFDLEARAIAKLKHPHIVSLYHFGEEQGLAYMVMEFVEGHDLKYYFDKNITFTLPEVMRLMSGLLDALAHAHDKNVWHRDIKPANVMIDIDGEVKLTDFGVSRMADQNEHSRVGTMVGTLQYMSPEQIQALPVSQRSDIFAAGLILYQFLCGVRAFQGSDYEIRQQIVNQMPAPPSSIQPGLPAALDGVIARALAKQPEQRFATAREFLLALRQAIGERQEPVLDMDATRMFYASHGSKTKLEREIQMPSKGQRSAASESAEIAFWESIKNSQDAEEFTLYLSRFPQGIYASLAHKRIERLQGATSAASLPANSGVQGARRIEPSFSAAHEAMPVPPAPAMPAPAPRKWMLPAGAAGAVLLLLGAWFLRAPEPTGNPQANGGIAAAPRASAPLAQMAQSSVSAPLAPAASSTLPGPPPALLAELNMAQTHKAAVEKHSQQVAEKLNKDARENEAERIAKHNIEQAKLKTGNSLCLVTDSKMPVKQDGKTEAETCTAARQRAQTWIAGWNTPAGQAKGHDKFRDGHIGECQCNGGECAVEISYQAPCL
ncbi:protein kinase [Massilia sp. W12]|uniref:serine/threonine protein kinase n=1 Tax=Massilia sp. W12 TaxID=3126507 RepID=UPI0030CCD92F